MWQDASQVEDVTEMICAHIESAYQENSPERIYFIMLYNIFHDFLTDVDEDVLPNELVGYENTLVWKKLFNFQHDAAIGLINKLESYNGCILADSVGLGKTFTALAVIKYYELRNKSVLVLVPKKLADNWLTYNRNLVTNIFAKDRFNYDVLCHTDLGRESGYSFGTPLNQVNWGNYDLVVIDESHNFRNNDAVKDRETRYQKLMNDVIRAGVKTRLLRSFSKHAVDNIQLLQQNRVSLFRAMGWLTATLGISISFQSLLQLAGYPNIVHHQATRLVFKHAVNPCNRLHQVVAFHGLINVHGMTHRRIKAG